MTNNEPNNEMMKPMIDFLRMMVGPEAAEEILEQIKSEGGVCYMAPGMFAGHSVPRKPEPEPKPAEKKCECPTNNADNTDKKKYTDGACRCGTPMNEKPRNTNYPNLEKDRNIYDTEKVKHHVSCHTNFYGATNVYTDTNGGHHIKMMLPGFKKEDISVSYLGKELTIKAVHEQKVSDVSGGETVYVSAKEEFAGAETVTRKFTFENALYEQTTMSLADGILTVDIPAKPAETPTAISFE